MQLLFDLEMQPSQRVGAGLGHRTRTNCSEAPRAEFTEPHVKRRWRWHRAVIDERQQCHARIVRPWAYPCASGSTVEYQWPLNVT